MVRRIIFSTIITFFISQIIFAQKEKNTSYKASEVKDTSMHSETYHTEHHIDFPNLLKENKYYNKKQLQEITKLSEAKNTTTLLPLLEDYISNFRIINFSEDTDMLWKLAQLYE